VAKQSPGGTGYSADKPVSSRAAAAVNEHADEHAAPDADTNQDAYLESTHAQADDAEADDAEADDAEADQDADADADTDHARGDANAHPDPVLWQRLLD